MRKTFESLRTSLWFLPTLIVFSSVCCALLLLEVDIYLEDPQFAKHWPRLFGAGSDGSRELLAVIASSVITVAGVAFSITVVVLALASSQYSPRVLRNFMRDWHNQTVLGGFLGIFAYCLVVLRTVRGEDHNAFVPSLAILGSLIFAFVGIGLLIYFIHHIASSIHTTSIVRSVHDETIEAIQIVFPRRLQEIGNPSSDASATKNLFEHQRVVWRPVASTSTGYIKTVNLKSLFHFAREKSLMIKMDKCVGQFVVKRMPIAYVNQSINQECCEKIMSAFDLGNERTLEQDVGYGIRQLVDVALKGLSPGINDTTSSLICIDHLGAILAHLADRETEEIPLLTEGGFGVIPAGPSFQWLVAETFNQVRQNGEKNPVVLLRIVETVTMVMQQTSDPQRIQILKEQANHVKDVARASIHERDRTEIEKALIALDEVAG